MKFYAIEKRRHNNSFFWSVANPMQKMSLAKGRPINGPIKIKEDYSNNDAELNDFQGNGLGAIVSQAFVDALKPLGLVGITYQECELTNVTVTKAYHFMAFNNRISGIVDHQRSSLYYAQSTPGNISEVFNLSFVDNATSLAGPDKLRMFTIEELPLVIFIGEEIANLLADFNPSGLRLFPLDIWFSGIESRHGYLNPNIQDSFPIDTMIAPEQRENYSTFDPSQQFYSP